VDVHVYESGNTIVKYSNTVADIRRRVSEVKDLGKDELLVDFARQ
jgi:hypothetical protein